MIQNGWNERRKVGMKIAMIGYSGSGKSTLARFLGKCYQVPVLHLDCIHWLPGWKERDGKEEQVLVEQFMDANDSWVIDGNYTKLSYQRRMNEADRIIFLNFNRFTCLYRAWKRLMRYRGEARESMTEGCTEKLDLEFIWWILYKGRTRKYRKRYQAVRKQYPEKVTVIRSQRQLDAFVARICHLLAMSRS